MNKQTQGPPCGRAHARLRGKRRKPGGSGAAAPVPAAAGGTLEGHLETGRPSQCPELPQHCSRAEAADLSRTDPGGHLPLVQGDLGAAALVLGCVLGAHGFGCRPCSTSAAREAGKTFASSLDSHTGASGNRRPGGWVVGVPGCLRAAIKNGPDSVLPRCEH